MCARLLQTSFWLIFVFTVTITSAQNTRHAASFSELVDAAADANVNEIVLSANMVATQVLEIDRLSSLSVVGNCSGTLSSSCVLDLNSHHISVNNIGGVSFNNLKLLNGLNFNGYSTSGSTHTAGVGGGAVFILAGNTAVFTSVTFKSNGAYEGGAVYLAHSASANFIGCSFLDNRAHKLSWNYRSTLYHAEGEGGAVYLSPSSSTNFSQCTFQGNSADLWGGALYISSETASVNIDACTFLDNTSPKGPAITSLGQLTFSDNVTLNYDDVFLDFSAPAVVFTRHGGILGKTVRVSSGVELDSAMNNEQFDVIEIASNMVLTRVLRVYRGTPARLVGVCDASQCSIDLNSLYHVAIELEWEQRTLTFESVWFVNGLRKVGYWTSSTSTTHTSGEGGGAVYLSTGSKATFISCIFDSSRAYEGGAVFLAPLASASFTDCQFMDNNADRLSWIYTPPYPDVTYYKEGLGGAVYLDSTASADFSRCTFLRNHADRFGGAVFASHDTSVTFDACTLEHNTAPLLQGPEIYTEGQLTFSTNGTAMELDHVRLHPDAPAVIFKRHEELSSNLVQVASGVELDSAMNNEQFSIIQLTTNIALHRVLRVYRQSSVHVVGLCGSQPCEIDFVGYYHITIEWGQRSVVFESLRFVNGLRKVGYVTSSTSTTWTSGEGGGAVYVSSGTSANFTSCTFDSNRAYEGGAVYLATMAYAWFSKCYFVNNVGDPLSWVYTPPYPDVTYNVEGQGGALYMSPSSSADFLQCIFRENTAARQGGAFYISTHASVTLQGCTLQQNSAPQLQGSEMYVIGQVTFSDVTTMNFDDIYMALSAPTVTFTRHQRLQNTIEVSSGLELDTAVNNDRFSIIEISSNIALNRIMRVSRQLPLEVRGRCGSVKCVIDLRAFTYISLSHLPSQVTFDSLHMENGVNHDGYSASNSRNTHTPGEGGGIFHVSHATLKVNSCTLSSSIAYEGGAVYLGQESSANFVGCSFLDNQADQFSWWYTPPYPDEYIRTEGEGGAFFLASGSSAVLDSCSFVRNVAASGGSIFTSADSSIVLINCALLDNEATQGSNVYALGQVTQSGSNTILTNTIVLDSSAPPIVFAPEPPPYPVYQPPSPSIPMPPTSPSPPFPSPPSPSPPFPSPPFPSPPFPEAPSRPNQPSPPSSPPPPPPSPPSSPSPPAFPSPAPSLPSPPPQRPSPPPPPSPPLSLPPPNLPPYAPQASSPPSPPPPLPSPPPHSPPLPFPETPSAEKLVFIADFEVIDGLRYSSGNLESRLLLETLKNDLQVFGLLEEGSESHLKISHTSSNSTVVDVNITYSPGHTISNQKLTTLVYNPAAIFLKDDALHQNLVNVTTVGVEYSGPFQFLPSSQEDFSTECDVSSVANLNVKEVSEDECPDDISTIEKCDEVQPGSLCSGYADCARFSNDNNNCGQFTVYKKLKDGSPSAIEWGVFAALFALIPSILATYVIELLLSSVIEGGKQRYQKLKEKSNDSGESREVMYVVALLGTVDMASDILFAITFLSEGEDHLGIVRTIPIFIVILTFLGNAMFVGWRFRIHDSDCTLVDVLLSLHAVFAAEFCFMIPLERDEEMILQMNKMYSRFTLVSFAENALQLIFTVGVFILGTSSTGLTVFAAASSILSFSSMTVVFALRNKKIGRQGRQHGVTSRFTNVVQSLAI